MDRHTIVSDRLRSFIFGVEDSLVSTLGLVSGVAAVGSARGAILLTGTILIFVEAFSMAVGTLLSDNSVQEFRTKVTVPLKNSLVSSVIMFFSYFLSGIIVIIPYVLTTPDKAFYISIIISLVCLFILGSVSAKFSGLPLLKRGVVMALIGGVAILIGVAVGNVVLNFN